MLFNDNILAVDQPISLQLLNVICLQLAQTWAKEVLSNEQQCTSSFCLVPHACLIDSSKGLES